MSTRSNEVLFVFPPGHGNGGAFRNHLGVAYVRAVLAQEGMATAQYVCRRPGSIDAVAADIVRHQSPIVGFTAYDENASLCVALARSIKRQKPEVCVVFGGPAPTFNAERLLDRHEAIDACVRGEAEGTAKDIFAGLLDGRLSDTAPPGVAFRRDGRVVCTPLPALVGTDAPVSQAALDATPSPYLSGILTDGRAGVLTGRGCTHHCQYCCFAALGRNRLRLHSTDRVLAELEYIAERRKRTREYYAVTIHDDTFTLLPPRAKALCQAIADRGLKLPLSCITRADTVDEELLRLMREAGFVSLAFGLESAVPSVLRATGKVRPPDWHDPDLQPERDFVDRVRNSVVAAKKYGFQVGVSIILGLPSETAADAAATLRLVKALPIDYYMHNFLWVFPGTPLWGTHDRYGIGCAMGDLGLAATTRYAYDVTKMKPAPKCALERDTRLVRLVASELLCACDASPISGSGLRAAVIQGELAPEVAAWLRDWMSIGGVVIQVYSRGTESKQSLRVEQDRRLLEHDLVPVRHHIHLLPKGGKGEGKWRIACAGVDLYSVHKPGLLAMTAASDAAPLIAWARGQGRSVALCDVAGNLRRPGELVLLLDGIEAPNPASPLRQMPPPPGLKYAGRWIRGKAPCRRLSRIEVDAEGQVRCCCHGEPIGKVGDSRRALARRLARFARAAEQRRGCAKCPSSNCPRCPFPGIDEKTYCALMTRHKRVQRCLEGIRLYSRLPMLVAVQQDNMATG